MNRSKNWRQIVSASIVNLRQAAHYLPELQTEPLQAVCKIYPMRINPYYLSLIKQKNGPVWRQVIPSVKEIQKLKVPGTLAGCAAADPLNEEKQSPVPNLTHRYPDRVLLLVSNQCAAYCRFCMRKRRLGNISQISKASIDEGMAYIRVHKRIREVILSGGDPLMLDHGRIEQILQQIRSIDHVELIRIHTRMPCTLPHRFTAKLVNMMRKYHPIYINTHFNHPVELTPEAAKACGRLVDAGFPLGCQSVLLKGVNDDYRTIRNLLRGLLKLRIKPYYLHHPDPVEGTLHFRVPIKTGQKIMSKVRGHISGTAVPHYVIDLPGGGGKIPLLPEYVKEVSPQKLIVRNYEDKLFEYPA